MLAELAAALFYGPTPVPEAERRCEELLHEATDRAGRANVLSFMAGLKALGGGLEDARRVVGEAATTYEEIGESYALANNSGRMLSRIEMLAGNATAAERHHAGVARRSSAFTTAPRCRARPQSWPTPSMRRLATRRRRAGSSWPRNRRRATTCTLSIPGGG